MIVCLHECLNSALKDKITSVLAQVLKCYAALVEVTPYKRLKPGLISEVVHNVNPLLYHKGMFPSWSVISSPSKRN